MVGRVVLVAVCEYEPDVVGELAGRSVLAVVHLGLGRAQIHRLLDDVVVVLQTEAVGVHRLVERPRVRLRWRR